MFLTADRIHNGHHFLPEGSILEVDEAGTILMVHNNFPSDDVLSHNGILCPGFVNVHCHLELSHMKGMIPEHTGLIPFLQKIPPYRLTFTDEQKKAARHEAYRELLQNGIVAVGDIANVNDTLDLRGLNMLHVHTFIESIGFTETYAGARFEEALKMFRDFASQQTEDKLLRQTVVPHAPYSVSTALFRLIDGMSPEALISIHNQESAAEDEYYIQKTGAVNDLLHGFGIDDGFFEPSGKSSLQTYLPWFNPDHPFIFVHNTWSSPEDIAFAMNYLDYPFWCFCPNANLYIENRLPDIRSFIDQGARICIGTDSLASNHQLCILSELNTIKEHFPELDWGFLLKCGTSNGAAALQMEGYIGDFAPGKRPGIINIIGLENALVKPSVQRLF